jgi:hypothetical protein
MTEETKREKELQNGVTRSIPPSHILEDGRFIYLPQPSKLEISKFFERSIARHGLLEADMIGKAVVKEDTASTTEEKDAAPKVHPLAVASARLQANGLSELNRTINLSGLVQTGEYFGLTTIVDPSLETAQGETKAAEPVQDDQEEEPQVKASYILKRKRAQFERASQILERHQTRLEAARQAQAVVDRRLFRLRRQWRLVAPEHGTRARLHGARPTEVVAIDVDVYDRDRVGGGIQALLGKTLKRAGRLASRVPRYATIELKDDFTVNIRGTDIEEQVDDKMETDETVESKSEVKKEKIDADKESIKMKPVDDYDDKADRWTRAEPFAVADPTLGRVMENFDPNKVPMLTLNFVITKSSSGFQQSASLSPMTTVSVAQGEATAYSADEQLLVSLQHSLFCASLFESMRSELDPETTSSSIGTATPSTTSAGHKSQPVVWLSCESEENFSAPPSVLAGDLGRGFAALSVVHCHEGEVKVQLDAEYTMCVTLVEADLESSPTTNESNSDELGKDNPLTSGSQTPPELHALCRALLLHSQDVYNKHSLYLRAHAKKKQEEEAAKGDAPRGLARIKKEDVVEKARILQSCVSLGSKMLFEQRVRKTLVVSLTDCYNALLLLPVSRQF